jgi:hypothetical protein
VHTELSANNFHFLWSGFIQPNEVINFFVDKGATLVSEVPPGKGEAILLFSYPNDSIWAEISSGICLGKIYGNLTNLATRELVQYYSEAGDDEFRHEGKWEICHVVAQLFWVADVYVNVSGEEYKVVNPRRSNHHYFALYDLLNETTGDIIRNGHSATSSSEISRISVSAEPLKKKTTRKSTM